MGSIIIRLLMIRKGKAKVSPVNVRIMNRTATRKINEHIKLSSGTVIRILAPQLSSARNYEPLAQ